MSRESDILSLLQSVMGKSRRIKNEHAFCCPFCNHHKPKLQVDINSQLWHCWVCDSKGRKLYTLLKKIGVPKDKLRQLASLLHDYIPLVIKKEEGEEFIALPLEFTSLRSKHNDLEYPHAIKYLRERGISYEEIIKYNIGYCPTGDYQGRIVIPSYDDKGKLNYFIARSYYRDTYLKYKYPKSPRNIIPFDLYINWKEPITLCEGVFDAIAFKRNAIPLLGKFMSKKIYEKIVRERPPKINIALDADARVDALKIANRLMGCGINVSLVEIDESDPSDLGYDQVNQILSKSTSLGFEEFIKLKLNT